ncbi:hypothetical protein ABZ619_35795 [Streptomyces sp. NPDC007851]|uniref:hypothetical protein n=1 Tax=Streptomyces sp. NPDC007851 TaxID=3155008 RepID=UPI0033D82F00
MDPVADSVMYGHPRAFRRAVPPPAALCSSLSLLEDLESQPWPSPHSVQVLIHDEEDDCFGLWMMHDGRLVEVPLPRTSRYFWRNHYTGEVDADCPGILMRTDKCDASPDGD